MYNNASCWVQFWRALIFLMQSDCVYCARRSYCTFRRIQAAKAWSRIGGKCAANVDVKLINDDDGIDRVCNRVRKYFSCMCICAKKDFARTVIVLVLACCWFGSFFYYFYHQCCCYYYSHTGIRNRHYTQTNQPTIQSKPNEKQNQKTNGEDMESAAENAACDRNEEVNCKNIRCKLLSWPEFRSSYFAFYFSCLSSHLFFCLLVRWGAVCAGALLCTFMRTRTLPLNLVDFCFFLIIRRNF